MMKFSKLVFVTISSGIIVFSLFYGLASIYSPPYQEPSLSETLSSKRKTSISEIKKPSAIQTNCPVLAPPCYWKNDDCSEKECPEARLHEPQKIPLLKPDISEAKLKKLATANMSYSPHSVSHRQSRHTGYHRPAMPKNATKSGSCSSRLLIDTKGYVSKVIDLECSEEIFEKPTIKAFKRWRFDPMIKDGSPVVYETEPQKIRYHLMNEDGNIIPE